MHEGNFHIKDQTELDLLKKIAFETDRNCNISIQEKDSGKVVTVGFKLKSNLDLFIEKIHGYRGNFIQ